MSADHEMTFAQATRLIRVLREHQLRSLEAIGRLEYELRGLQYQIALMKTSMEIDITDARLHFTFGPDSDDWVSLSVEEVRALKRVAELQLGTEQKRNGPDR